MSDVLAQVRIVLVEPAGPLNVGAIARVMKNMGLQQLVLVKPHCDPLSAEARQMAVHAGDLLETAVQVPSLPEALQGCQRAIATTSRGRALDTDMETPRSALPWLIESLILPANPTTTSASSPNSPQQSALIFGPEDRGLSNEELNYAQRFIRIPSSPIYPSLNLAQAVAVCCYELGLAAQELAEPNHKATSAASPANLPAPSAPLAPLDVLEGYYQQLEAVLLKIGYLYPHTAPSRMEKFRRLFNRSQLSAAEVAMLRGILSQVEWAMQQAAKD